MRSRRRAEPDRRRSRKPGDSKAPSAGLPSPEALLEFLRDNPEALGTREIGRAFGLNSTDQPALRAMLRAVAQSGELVRGGDRRFAAGASLPETMPVERRGSDAGTARSGGRTGLRGSGRGIDIRNACLTFSVRHEDRDLQHQQYQPPPA